MTEDITFYNHEHVGAEIIRKELEELKFSNKDIDTITGLISFHMRSIQSTKSARKLLSEFDERGLFYKDFIRLKIADRKGRLPQKLFPMWKLRNLYKHFHDVINYEEPFTVRSIAVDGNDVMRELGIGPGKKVGQVLNSLFNRVLDFPDLNDRDKLLEMIREYKGG